MILSCGGSSVDAVATLLTCGGQVEVVWEYRGQTLALSIRWDSLLCYLELFLCKIEESVRRSWDSSDVEYNHSAGCLSPFVRINHEKLLSRSIRFLLRQRETQVLLVVS